MIHLQMTSLMAGKSRQNKLLSFIPLAFFSVFDL